MNKFIDNINDNAKVAIALVLAEEVLKTLKDEKEGYLFCKAKIDMCWNWLKGEKIDMEEFYDCLDDEEEKDIISLANNVQDKTISNAYGLISEAISFTAVIVNQNGQNEELPEYLEDVDDEFLEDYIQYILDNKIYESKKFISLLKYLQKEYFKADFNVINKEELSDFI